MRPQHYFISESDGCLYDTRNGLERPIRENYQRTHREIKTLADLKATLRAGGFAWPGGYPLYFVMGDGETMAFSAVRAEFRRVAEGMRDGDRDWTPVWCEVNWEDVEMTCAHTGERIPSAYGEE